MWAVQNCKKNETLNWKVPTIQLAPNWSACKQQISATMTVSLLPSTQMTLQACIDIYAHILHIHTHTNTCACTSNQMKSKGSVTLQLIPFSTLPDLSHSYLIIVIYMHNVGPTEKNSIELYRTQCMCRLVTEICFLPKWSTTRTDNSAIQRNYY